jgi:hypothetical protein
MNQRNLVKSRNSITAPKVILLSLDGATDSIVDKYLANGA